ncbi:MAG: hypothetical protein N2376_11215 [Clostridia bacterium]|nr:hypothetical protein [Clostridia bacterium]
MKVFMGVYEDALLFLGGIYALILLLRNFKQVVENNRLKAG